MPSSSGLPSLFTVTDLLRPIAPRKRDWRNLPSDLGALRLPSGLVRLGLLPELAMRKKFLNLVGKLLVPLPCLLEGIELSEKLRFSCG